MESMNFFSKENIILLVLGFIVFNIFIPVNSQQTSNIDYEIKLHDMEQELNLKQKIINQKDFKIKKFKNEKNKIDSVTDSYNVNQLDSFYTDFFK